MALYIDGKKVIGTNPTYTFTLLPIADNTYDIGSASYSYRQLHVETAIYATSVTGHWKPSADDTYDLGDSTTPLEWRNLYLDGTAYVDAISCSGKIDVGVFGDGTGVSTGTTGDVIGIYTEVPTGTTVSDTVMGLRVRQLVNAAQIADCSIYAIQGQLRVKQNMADGVHAGLFGYFEQSGTVTLSESAGGYNAAVSAGVETGGTFVLGAGAVLAGVLISSVGLDAGTYTGNYDAVHIIKATGREIWQKAVNIVAASSTYGVVTGDDIIGAYGTTLDSVMVHKSGSLNADTNLSGVLVGASQDTTALAANSLIISNITTDGDILIAVSDGGHSKQMLFLDGSTGITHIGRPGTPNDVTSTGDVFVGGYFEAGARLYTRDNIYMLDDKRINFGSASDGGILYETNDGDARHLWFVIDESDDTGDNVPVFAFAEETGASAVTGLFDTFVEPLVCVVDNDKDSWFGITFSADDTPALAIGGAATGVAIQGTTGVVQRMAYAQILEILGDCSGFYPLTDATGTTVTDFTANGQDGTPSKDVGTWDTIPAYQGSVQVYDFDGVDEEFDVADNALFSTATAFSVGAAVNMTAGTDSTIIAVWDVDNTFREFRLYLDASGYPSFECYDESGDDTIGREDQTAIGTGSWHTIFGVMDGGTDAANLKIYVDGVATDDNDIADDVGFADIEDTGAALMIGHIISSGVAELHDGGMWGAFYTKKELSADEAWNLHQIYRGLLNF